jgi:hypothetical protein
MIKSLITDDDLKFLDENIASLREKYLPAALKRPITKEELDDSRARVTMSRARQAAREAAKLAACGAEWLRKHKAALGPTKFGGIATEFAELMTMVALIGLVALGAWRSRADRRINAAMARALRVKGRLLLSDKCHSMRRS